MAPLGHISPLRPPSLRSSCRSILSEPPSILFSYVAVTVCGTRSCCSQFMISVILLGLTAYRIHYTKEQDRPDILTSRRHFYSGFSMISLVFTAQSLLSSAPIVAELLTTAILGTLFSLWMYDLDHEYPSGF